MSEITERIQEIPQNLKGKQADTESGHGEDTRTDDQKKVDKQLAERLCGMIENANERVVPLIKSIRKHIENMDAKKEEDRDEAELEKQVRPQLEQAEKILNETNGAVRGADPDNRLASKAKRNAADHRATPEEQRLAEALKVLIAEVGGTVDWAKNKLDSFPKAKKNVGPLLDALAQPLTQIVGAVGLLLAGVLNLVGRLLSGLGLDGLLKGIVAATHNVKCVNARALFIGTVSYGRAGLSNSSRAQYVHDEIELALKDTLELKGEEWREVTAFSWVQDIVARASNRIFVGEPLCRDKAWIKLQQEGAGTIMGAALFINLFPEILRPVIGRLISPSARRAKQAAEFLKPIFDERMNMDPAERPADMITWMYECAPEEEHNVVDIASRIVVTNFAAIHTSGMTFTHALLWLVARPEYVPALREEVRAITERYGWTKDAIAKMVKLDSFMKETMRISPLGPQILSRKVIHPFTFSNGVTIPAGETVSCHLYGVHRDNEIYPDPQEFDGWRFLGMNPGYTGGDPKATAGNAILKGLTDENEEEKGGKETKKTMYTTSRSFLAFGHGRHSCPGRFFAALELKAILASLVLGYDLRWPDDAPKDDGHGRGYRPKDIWFGGNTLPDMKARVLIRKRA
ncbi:cytochrome P450 [Serendipita vermifera]|nr:cytochrome P450 [Serendipita vermifera]